MYKGEIKGEKRSCARTRTPSALFTGKSWSVCVYLWRAGVGVWEFSVAVTRVRAWKPKRVFFIDRESSIRTNFPKSVMAWY